VGIFIVLFMLGMMHGNHIGHVENWFLIAFAVGIVFVMARDYIMRKRGLLR
jgi:DMSO reductase anchor subunit